MAEFDAVKWMAEHGHPGYANEIAELEARKAEVFAEGQQLPYCSSTIARLNKLNEQIEEVRRAAWDRWDDWRSDPLD
jgi:hypothetical protein